jgi:hypothetical protein
VFLEAIVKIASRVEAMAMATAPGRTVIIRDGVVLTTNIVGACMVGPAQWCFIVVTVISGSDCYSLLLGSFSFDFYGNKEDDRETLLIRQSLSTIRVRFAFNSNPNKSGHI